MALSVARESFEGRSCNDLTDKIWDEQTLWSTNKTHKELSQWRCSEGISIIWWAIPKIWHFMIQIVQKVPKRRLALRTTSVSKKLLAKLFKQAIGSSIFKAEPINNLILRMRTRGLQQVEESLYEDGRIAKNCAIDKAPLKERQRGSKAYGRNHWTLRYICGRS